MYIYIYIYTYNYVNTVRRTRRAVLDCMEPLIALDNSNNVTIAVDHNVINFVTITKVGNVIHTWYCMCWTVAIL